METITWYFFLEPLNPGILESFFVVIKAHALTTKVSISFLYFFNEVSYV